MLNPARALTLSSTSAPELPRVEGLEALYDRQIIPRHGDTIMVAGRSATQKSGFALWYTSRMNIPTLYLAGDMTPFQVSCRLASSMTGMTTPVIEDQMVNNGYQRRHILDQLSTLRMQFSFGPIYAENLDAELDAYVELHDANPSMIVVDNLMDVEGADSDYSAQMAALVALKEISQDRKCSMMVLHHASDKSWEAKSDPWGCPSRDQIKNGLGEKPEIVLGVALNPHTHEYRVAALKNRMGPQDPTGRTYARLRAYPEVTRFGPWVEPQVIRPGSSLISTPKGE